MAGVEAADGEVVDDSAVDEVTELVKSWVIPQ